jgi:stearoyl-CoA desaturase (delta-9 desaturase)
MSTAVADPPRVKPSRKTHRNTLLVLVAMHLLALLAFIPYCFTWWGIPIVLVGNAIFGSIGINLGYHRLLTHRSLVVPRWLEKTFTVCGLCSLEGPPIQWVAVHRIHHQFSDVPGDPHSPVVDDFYYGHVGWTYSDDPVLKAQASRYVPDLISDPFQKWLHKRNRWHRVYYAHVAAIVLAGFLLGLALYGTWADAVHVMVLAFVWGVAVRTVYVWHITWLVNSAAHRWGYANYHTNDASRNNWFVAMLTNGEGWHNNHHAAPRAASHGHRWWEIDLTFTFVRMLEMVGLAKQVVPIKVADYKQVA